MKRYRSVFQLLCLLLVGWIAGLCARQSCDHFREAVKKIETPATVSHDPSADLSDGQAVRLSLEAVVTPSLTYHVPLSVYVMATVMWVAVRTEKLIRRTEIFYFFFSFFRRIFGHHIAINAP
ncbi:hypothetical protein [Larkinella soli]|uniref:hypothetical protein n=1 Tax=Larkinella soli TaxID=1770527 RepID=UPI000FFC086E|nr:hypothetical protein [Larkinella soli]